MAVLKINDKLNAIMQQVITLNKEVDTFLEKDAEKIFREDKELCSSCQDLIKMSSQLGSMICVLGDCIGYNIASQAFDASKVG